MERKQGFMTDIGKPRGEHEEQDEQRQRRRPVKVTDKRRVGPDPEAGAALQPVADAGAELEEARKAADEYRDHLLRLKAEFDNYRKRVLKEQTRAVEMASEPLMRRLLEVLDEFDLALMAAERGPDFERFLHGVELVYAKLMDILRSEGLERIEEAAWSRRHFLRTAATMAAGATLAPIFTPRTWAAVQSPKVVIVGAGTTGLTCAYRLQQHGIIARVIEASTRVGGRMFSLRDFFPDNQLTELGGEYNRYSP